MGNGKSLHTMLLLCYSVAVLCCARDGRAQFSQDLKGGIIQFEKARKILEERKNISGLMSALSSTTERVDPLNKFKKYKGGYNITSKHYISSVIYTGRYGYITGAVWIFGGLLYAIVSHLISRTCCFKESKQKRRLPCSKQYCLWPVLLGLFLTSLAITASVLALIGSSKFNSRVQSIKDVIVDTTEEASGTIHKVTEAMMSIQGITESGGSVDGYSQLNSTLVKLQQEATHVQQKAEKSMRRLQKGIRILRLMIILTIVVNIAIVLSLLASRPLNLNWVLKLCIILCWLFTFLFWIYFGLYFFLDKFSGDTCAALEEYDSNPENSTLSSILPCSEKLSASMTLQDVQEGIHNRIDQVNYNISLAKSSNFPYLEYVCNPFSGPPGYDYQPENCSSNTIKIGEIAQILKRFTCSGSDGEACAQGEFIPVNTYTKIQVYTSSIQDMLDAFPSMERLADCRLVKDAFSKVLVRDCKPLKKYAYVTWVSFTVLSTIMVSLLLILVLEAHHDYKYQNSDCSVISQPALIETVQHHTTTDAILEP